MINGRIVTILLAVLLSVTPSFAYEVDVHRLITRHAFARLQIDFRARLGIAKEHEINDRLLVELMQDGSENEDDLPRPLSHFLDPEHNAPLTTRAFGFCAPSGGRADSRARDIIQPLSLVYRDALLSDNAGTRDSFLKELFERLGHAIHLVQDMAQPEHTRNDQHLTYSDLFLSNGTAASVWEAWGQQNLVEKRDRLTGQIVAPAVEYGGYPTVRLLDYGSFFQTTEDTIRQRKGLANFSNRNFVTQDTNYSDQTAGTPCDILPGRCYEYEYPFLDERLTPLRRELVHEVVLDDGGNRVIRPVDEWVYTWPVYDAYTNQTTPDVFHTFHSLLDLETRRYGCPVYSLGDGSYLTRASMLIPRAVGYSAGFIEHFFRGSMDVTWTSSGDDAYDMTITNRSAEAIGADATVEAVFRADPSYFADGSSNDTGFIIGARLADVAPGFTGLAPGQSVVVRGVRPFGLHPGDPLTKFERRVVVMGTLGDTPNEIIGIIQPPVTTKGLRAEFTWSSAPLSDGSFAHPRILITDGIGADGWFPLGYGYEDCSNQIPSLCIEVPPPPYQPVIFKINPFPAGTTFWFQLGGFCARRETFTLTANFYLEDQLVKTETSVVREGCLRETTFATYP